LRYDVMGTANQNPNMVQNLIAVFSLLIGLGGLSVTYAAHRHKVRQESEAAAIRERGWTSMAHAKVDLLQHPLTNEFARRVEIEYQGAQPIMDVRVSFRGEVIGEFPFVMCNRHEYAQLPPAESNATDSERHITLEFTDPAGIRWKREASGFLRRARQDAEGLETRDLWGPPEPPNVQRWNAPTGQPASTPGSRRRGFLRAAVVLVSVLIVAGGVWWLLHH
jgi:hypothetical protein